MSANYGGQFLSSAVAKLYLLRTHRSYVHKSITSLQQKCKHDDALCHQVLALTEDSEITRKVSWFQKEVPSLVECSFDQTAWNKCRRSQKRRTLTDPSWRKEVLSTLKQHNNFCSFVFKRHIVKSFICTRKIVSAFHCEGHCNFSTCRVSFAFSVNDGMQKVRFRG